MSFCLDQMNTSVVCILCHPTGLWKAQWALVSSPVNTIAKGWFCVNGSIHGTQSIMIRGWHPTNLKQKASLEKLLFDSPRVLCSVQSHCFTFDSFWLCCQCKGHRSSDLAHYNVKKRKQNRDDFSLTTLPIREYMWNSLLGRWMGWLVILLLWFLP